MKKLLLSLTMIMMATIATARIISKDVEGANCHLWNTPDFFMNATAGDVDTCLFYGGADVEARDEKGWSPLLHAAAYGNASTIITLIQRGAYPTTKSDEGCEDWKTHEFYNRATAEDIRHCLDQGAYIETEVGEGDTPILAAVYVGSVEVVDALLESGANPYARTNPAYGEDSILHYAVWGENTLVVDYLLNNGYSYLVDERNRDGRTTLDAAILNNNPRIVQLLAKSGASDLDVALTWAESKGYTEIVGVLNDEIGLRLINDR